MEKMQQNFEYQKMTEASCKQARSLKNIYPVIIKLWHATCRPQNEWHTRSLHLMSLRRVRGGSGRWWWLKVKLQQCLLVPEGFNTMQKYVIKFNVDNTILAAPSSMENEVYRVQQKVKQQQLTLTNTQKWTVLQL